MVKIINAFIIMVKGILKDMLLVVCVLAPILFGFFIKIVLPYVEKIICRIFERLSFFADYYLIFDLVLCFLTTIMFIFSGTVVALEEMEEGIQKSLIVTPLGKKGYLIARLGIPMVISTLYDIVILNIFSLTEIVFRDTVVLSFLSGIMSVIICMFILAFANNRLEGMVYIKLLGFFVLGIPVPFFVYSDLKYIAGIFPCFWAALYSMNGMWINVMAALIVSSIWLIFLYKKYEKKLI